jgi:hypothetical protein
MEQKEVRTKTSVPMVKETYHSNTSTKHLAFSTALTSKQLLILRQFKHQTHGLQHSIDQQSKFSFPGVHSETISFTPNIIWDH